jgi:hypothetical protein
MKKKIIVCCNLLGKLLEGRAGPVGEGVNPGGVMGRRQLAGALTDPGKARLSPGQVEGKEKRVWRGEIKNFMQVFLFFMID